MRRALSPGHRSLARWRATFSSSIQATGAGQRDPLVESTFDATFARGDSPRGLRAQRAGAPSITGAFSIADVPDGRYVVLAAFENDARCAIPTRTSPAPTPCVLRLGNVDMSESFRPERSRRQSGTVP